MPLPIFSPVLVFKLNSAHWLAACGAMLDLSLKFLPLRPSESAFKFQLWCNATDHNHFDASFREALHSVLESLLGT